MTYSDYDIDIPRGKTTGQVYTICPKCSQDRKKKHAKCLSVNLDKGMWHCHHATCGWTGSLNKKQYQVPKWENTTSISDKIVEWFLKRNISQDTLVKMRVTEKKEWMPQVEAERNVICFNYFRDDKIVNTKFRDAEKNFKLFKDAELIFYNLDGIKNHKEIYIVEGEIDCLTMIQLGHINTISVPNGATKGLNNLQYLDNCYQYFELIEKVFILTDNDEPGEKLGQELARRLGIEKCFRVNLGIYKDINEMYCQTGKIDLNESTPFPIEGVFEVNSHWDKVKYILKNGFPKGWKPRPPLGELIQIHPGYTSIITGIPGHGKSEYLDQILMQLCVDYNLRGGYFSPENRPTELHVIKLVEKILGKSAWKANEMELDKAREFLNDHVYWIYPEEGYDLDNILEKIRQAVLRYGINWFVLDPWNKIEHLYTGISETKYISESLDKIANFNHKNGTHGFIVAHPTKMKFNYDTGQYEVPGLYDISGSSNFFNKADIGLTIYKERSGDVFKNTVYVQKVKFKYWGNTGQMDYTWNHDNGRYDNSGIDVSNWLNPKIEPQQIVFDKVLDSGYRDPYKDSNDLESAPF